LGRLYISGENPQINKLLQENPVARSKVKRVWDWVLENHNDPVIFEGFGFWVNLEKGIFTPNELAERLILTLRRTGGYLEWDLGLVENIVQLAQNSATETLEIARLFLLEGGVRKGKNRIHFTFDKNWIEAFRILYENILTRPQTVLLISELIREGGRLYWPLKDILGATYS
jgi:hypothetical protein